ncbi:Imm42 family immunity protein [Herbaspirillum chlorophenolicum]|uniref:Imm42 family immunity protein n=1 Tax=Herbaspirillum chlorophenolicum TaxID=211589 RepID=UPI00067E0299|nr:Imm42 family immunity protein [Herbaspirillum chlorophenolicum]
MRFGITDRFSIEIVLDRVSGGDWLFGKICYWVNGVEVGNFDEGTSLRDVLFMMTTIVADGSHRICPKLLEFSNEKTFSLICNALDDEDETIYQYLPEDFQPARFDIRIPVDVFDDWKIFLVEGEFDAKLICRRLGAGDIEPVVMLRQGEFDDVLRQAYDYLDNIYKLAQS